MKSKDINLLELNQDDDPIAISEDIIRNEPLLSSSSAERWVVFFLFLHRLWFAIAVGILSFKKNAFFYTVLF